MTPAPAIFSRAARAGGLALLLLLASCAWRIVPPSDVTDPVTVYVVDYGRHARLLLPGATRDRWTEYGFGDWEYYALSHTGLFAGLRALAGSPQATLSRRTVSRPPGEAPTELTLGGERLAALAVERTRAERLSAALAERYRARQATEVFNPRLGLYFVKDDSPYHLYRNSNHEVASWLRALGCRIRGTPVLSNFEVE